jgi:nicotinamidase-related amidase
MKILVVVDMQNDFIDGALGTPEAQAIVEPMAEFIRNWDGPVYYTMDVHFQDYMTTREGRYLPVPHCISGTSGIFMNDKIDKVLKEKLAQQVVKYTFGSEGLGSFLHYYHSEEDEIYFCGVCTDVCVIANLVIAKTRLPETNIYVIEDLCAGVSPKKHKAAIEVMKSLQVEIVNSKEVANNG